MTLNLGDSIEL